MIFLDANFLISLFAKKPKFHDRAVQIWEENESKDKIISKLIITEVVTVLNVKIRENVDLTDYAYNYMNDNLMIVDDSNCYDLAMKKVKKYYPERIPLFDCVYMALMEDLDIKEIVSFDKHFDNKEGIERVY